MIAILGTGKMGEALLSGLLRAGRSPSAVVAAVRREDRGAELRERYGIQVTDAASAAKLASTLVLAVKPQDMGKLLAEIAPAVPPDRLVVSVGGRDHHGVHRAAAGRGGAGRPGHVEHPGPGGRGDERDLGRVVRGRGAPAPGRGPVPPGGQGAAHPRIAAGRGDRAVRQRPRVRLLPGRVDGGRGHPARHGARCRAGDGHPGGLRRGHHAAGIGRASGDPARGGHLARAAPRSPRSGSSNGTGCGPRSWPPSRRPATAAGNSAPIRPPRVPGSSSAGPPHAGLG